MIPFINISTKSNKTNVSDGSTLSANASIIDDWIPIPKESFLRFIKSAMFSSQFV
jgi:hypothetical protein